MSFFKYSPLLSVGMCVGSAVACPDGLYLQCIDIGTCTCLPMSPQILQPFCSGQTNTWRPPQLGYPDTWRPPQLGYPDEACLNHPLGNENSFIRNPSQIWGGDNSAFNNPGSILGARPRNELWRILVKDPGDNWNGYRPLVFTYVLAGNSGGDSYKGSDDIILHARRNLEALLKEVRAMNEAESGDNLISANLFCIPGDASGNFSYFKSGHYLNAFSKILQDSPSIAERLEGPGPLLISTRRPIDELLEKDLRLRESQDRDTRVFLIDLSMAEPASVTTFLREFKLAIRERDVLEDAELTPLRPRLISALIRLNEAIPFIESAVASQKAKSRD